MQNLFRFHLSVSVVAWLFLAGYGRADSLRTWNVPPEAFRCYTATHQTRDVLPLAGQRGIYVATDGGLLEYDRAGTFIRKYTRRDGLGAHTLREILLSPDGDLWVATREGVVRKAPSGWHLYNEQNSGLNDNRVYCIGQDRAGIIYAGTHRGISRWTGARFEPFDDTHEFARRATCAIHCAADGTVWFAKENGLSRYLGNGRWEIFQKDVLQKGKRTDLPSNNILCMAADFQNHLWIGTKMGLGRYDGDSWRKWYFEERLFDGKGILDNRIATLAVDRTGRVWLAHGFSRDFAGAVGLTSFLGDDWRYMTTKEGLPSNAILRIRMDENNDPWLATDHGACRIHGEQVTSYDAKGELPGNGIRRLTSLGAGGVAALIGDNVVVFKKGEPVSMSGDAGISDFKSEISNLDGPGAPPDARVTQRDVSGRLWMGTRDNGLWLDHGKAWQRVLLNGYDFPREITALCFEDAETLWVGTAQEGLFRVNIADLQEARPEPDSWWRRIWRSNTP